MDKRLIHAVAGSGKTTEILKSLRSDQRSLIVTYTNENFESLRAALAKIDPSIAQNVTLLTYYTFLYRFCFQPFLWHRLRNKGIYWSIPPVGPRTPSKKELGHWLTSGQNIYSSRISKVLIYCGLMDRVRQRLEKYFDAIFIDEVQDIAANDFDFILELSKASVSFLAVGDYYQHTFDTGKDGRKRHSLYKNGLAKYLKEFERAGITVDTESLIRTWRCSPSICSFITEKIGVNIESHRTDVVIIETITSRDRALEIYNDDEVVKLFWSQSRQKDCYANNWGKSKGLDCYEDVCVVMTKDAWSSLLDDDFSRLTELTTSKLYVACSRAKGNLYFVEGEALKKWLM